MGKPIGQSRNEFGGFFERAEHMLEIAPDALAPGILPDKIGFHRRIEHEPLGVVLDIAAWNYPLLIAVNVVIPALLAGNSVLLKHSARTPLCGIHFERAFGQQTAGLVQNLILTHDQTLALIRNGGVDHVVFTGSVPGGKAIHRAVAERFIDAGLELGGKDPAYIAEDADLDFTVPNVVDGACYNAGQSCCAVERVYVHRNVYEAFIERAEAIMRRYRLGDPLDEGTTMGPLASSQAPDFLDRQVADAVATGRTGYSGWPAIVGYDGEFLSAHLVDRSAQRRGDHAGGELRSSSARSDGGKRPGGPRSDERFALWPDGFDLDSRPGAGRMVCRAVEGRNRLPESMRLSRSSFAVVRVRRQRKGVEPFHVRVLSFDPPQEHPFQDRYLIIHNRSRNTQGRYKWL